MYSYNAEQNQILISVCALISNTVNIKYILIYKKSPDSLARLGKIFP